MQKKYQKHIFSVQQKADFPQNPSFDLQINFFPRKVQENPLTNLLFCVILRGRNELFLDDFFDAFSRGGIAMGRFKIRWPLVVYDIYIFVAVHVLLLFLYSSNDNISVVGRFALMGISFACVFAVRLVGKVYKQIWRYGGIQGYIRFLFVDGIAFLLNYVLVVVLPVQNVTFARTLAISCMNLLGVLAIRMLYRYAFTCAGSQTWMGRLSSNFLHFVAGIDIDSTDKPAAKTPIAIVGAGRVGVALAKDLLENESAAYTPRCFIDVNQSKTDMSVLGIPVLLEDDFIVSKLRNFGVSEVVFAIPNIKETEKKRQYSLYLDAGFKIKTYDFPVMQAAGGKRHLREFDIEELLFRSPVSIHDERTNAYYRDRVVLITGGGGSIGSELCRQLAKMQPKQMILLDIYENGVYDVQQELRIAYGNTLDLRVEIASITNKNAMERVFDTYRPEIVINAAAHKHVPLMEHNCIEAVENNVFGTEILVSLCEMYGTKRFMMVSTDKAVNPTNVMGATKRMCEMIVQGASTAGNVTYSATRFGNVLGSAGSVIPLFKKQIANGGPITITDKRIIRYFMTIPEASQLVLQSGAMAKNGELFVLDMGQPVKILDLAENMIRLSGVKEIEIRETGLRPGEKLYEELLVKTDELDKTDNQMIFIERELPVSHDEVMQKLELLRKACRTGSDDLVRETLKYVVPTYKSPEELNARAEESKEMKAQRKHATV